MLMGEILSSLIMIFILMVPGVIFRKTNLISIDQSNGISSVVVNLT